MIPPWDEQRFLDSLGSMRSIAGKLLHAFQLSLQSHLIEIQSALNDNDRDKINHIAHTIKGSARQLHFVALAQWAAELEQLVSSQNSDALAKSVNQLICQAEHDLQTTQDCIEKLHQKENHSNCDH